MTTACIESKPRRKQRPRLRYALKQLGACRGALDWINWRQDPEKAWKECHRGDWLLWIVCDLFGPWSKEYSGVRIAFLSAPSEDTAEVFAVRAAISWETVAAKIREKFPHLKGYLNDVGE